jgi:hypothetical protein
MNDLPLIVREIVEAQPLNNLRSEAPPQVTTSQATATE